MNTVAVILAGGTGKRFFPIVTSKPLLPFFSKPILDHTIEALRGAGFSQIVIVANKENQKQIREIFKGDKTVKLAIQQSAKGMADALLTAEKYVRGKPIFVLNATDLVNDSLYQLAFRNISKFKAFIIAKKQKEYIDLGYLNFSGKKLVGIVEKPGEGKQPSNLINLVFHYFSSSNEFIVILKSTHSKKDDIYEKALSTFIKKSEVTVLPYEGYWQPLKFPWHILNMSTLFLNNKLGAEDNSIQTSKSAYVDRNVYLGKGVKILENAVIKGPSYIGDNTVIGTNSLIIESMVGKNCVVGYGSEVSRTYIGDNCWLHNNFIGDSVLEGDNHIGAGAVTANFRFDEKLIYSSVQGERINSKRRKLGSIIGQSAKIGVNASIMPGVNIGPYSIIGPGVIQYKDVETEKKVFA